MIDYKFNAEAPPEILGPKLLNLQPGREAEIVSPEGSTMIFRDDPRYSDGTPSPLISLKIINYAGPHSHPCAEAVHEACRVMAKGNWADCLEYVENGWGVRWIFFYPKGSQ